MADVTSLETELQELIIDACNVPDAPEEVDPEAPLIGPDSPLGLDSLDAVEVVVAVQKKYDVRIGGQDTSREVLRSLRTLADFIRHGQS
ncbi:acyl carrier protein [Desulfuromonas versatilis]|uniref:Acyl carrier protein n=1 Tax=Desulfuromonas versatilis TaxID=2802975 RepID=A0ABN6DSP7_9BACT|nr:phosphopantetheine-binding protein [Desulfuromonas versatilis]BCR03208.1 acyl carrier protein [Desulfuromonas versatilis]